VTALLLAGVLVAAPVPRVGVSVSVEQPTRGPVVAVLGDVVVSSEVVGDVVALGGDVELAPGAVVRGDVVAVGGNASGSGTVIGRAVGVGGLGFNRGRVAGARGPVAWGLDLLRAGLWVTLGSLLVLLLPRWVRGAGERLARRSWQSPLIGVLALLVWLFSVMVALAVTTTPLGAACLLLAVGLLLAAKLVGIVGVAWVLGRAAARFLPGAWRSELPRTGVALLVLAGVSLVPVVGASLWLIANVVGIGAAVGALLAQYPLTLLFPRLATR
jgi:hypothetical protein